MRPGSEKKTVTDRYSSFLVVLEKDTREDDAQATIAAIQQIRGVAGVTPHVHTVEQTIADMRARDALAAKLLEILYPEKTG
jgi:hypothetical protein